MDYSQILHCVSVEPLLDMHEEDTEKWANLHSTPGCVIHILTVVHLLVLYLLQQGYHKVTQQLYCVALWIRVVNALFSQWSGAWE